MIMISGVDMIGWMPEHFVDDMCLALKFVSKNEAKLLVRNVLSQLYIMNVI